jgi:hypothetical protein
MGQSPIIEGVLEFPSVAKLDDVVDDLQHAGWLSEEETWVESDGRLNPVTGDYIAVNRHGGILRIPEGVYRNIHRGLPDWVADASAGGVVGTMRCRRVGLVGTAEDSMPGDNLQFVDLESWGTNHGWSNPPRIEDSEYVEEERDEWFREVATQFVNRHQNTVRGHLLANNAPVEATEVL